MNISISSDNNANKLSLVLLKCDLSGFSNNYPYPEKVDELVQEIIKIMPEWKEIISREQHLTHDYTLDIHTLLTLKKVKESEEYEELSQDEKLIILYTALLHDIGKKENFVDPDHPQRGAEKASSILYKLGFPEIFINHVFLLIINHQLLGLMAANRMELSIDKLLEQLHRSEIINLLLILTIADIKSVKKNEGFYCSTVKANIEKLKKEIESKFK